MRVQNRDNEGEQNSGWSVTKNPRKWVLLLPAMGNRSLFLKEVETADKDLERRQYERKE